MIKKIYNLWLRKKTNNFKRIPLFVMTFDYDKWKNGVEKSCDFHVHPDILEFDLANDEFIKNHLQEVVDYIRENYPMEKLTKI